MSTSVQEYFSNRDKGTYPSDKSNEKESPLTAVEHHNQLEGIRRIVHRRLQGRKPRCEVCRNTHLLVSALRHLDLRLFGAIFIGHFVFSE